MGYIIKIGNLEVLCETREEMVAAVRDLTNTNTAQGDGNQPMPSQGDIADSVRRIPPEWRRLLSVLMKTPEHEMDSDALQKALGIKSVGSFGVFIRKFKEACRAAKIDPDLVLGKRSTGRKPKVIYYRIPEKVTAGVRLALKLE
jgi:hypothetical protein